MDPDEETSTKQHATERLTSAAISSNHLKLHPVHAVPATEPRAQKRNTAHRSCISEEKPCKTTIDQGCGLKTYTKQHPRHCPKFTLGLPAQSCHVSSCFRISKLFELIRHFPGTPDGPRLIDLQLEDCI